MKLVLVLLASYLIGAIPFSYLFTRLFKGADPRKAGTGNVGATNALVVGGKTAGILALIGDTAKGAAAIALVRHYGFTDWGIVLSGLAAVLGHDFSIFLKFRGGKGVATTGGILLALDPIFTFIIILLWIFCMIILRYFIPSTILIICFIPVMMWMSSWRVEYIAFGTVNALLTVYAHRADLQRFFAGNELTIQESMAKYGKK